MKKWSLKMLVEAGIMIALAFILSKIKIYRAPNGGSVTAGSMIPIMLFALRWGAGPGIIAGVAFGLFKSMGGYILNIPQAILEYPVAFGCLGLAGLASGIDVDMKEIKTGKIVLSTFIAILARFICHLLAGVIFFKDTLPAGINGWIASAAYQSTYLVPEFIISAIILSLIWKPMSRVER